MSEEKMAAPSFWDDQESANRVIGQVNTLKSWLEPYKEVVKRTDDVRSLLKDALECQDAEFLSELSGELDAIEKEVSALEIRKMLSGEMDPCSCFLSINSGAGGTEACDWAQMLLRMYQRWATKRGWKVEVVDVDEGEVAGIRSATLKITGQFAYGYAKAEKGVHRLVRISPFDSNARRHTSFAAVDVTPEDQR